MFAARYQWLVRKQTSALTVALGNVSQVDGTGFKCKQTCNPYHMIRASSLRRLSLPLVSRVLILIVCVRNAP